jgi:hypothetical protein
MISSDVVSLFTSIPLDPAKRITNELLINDNSWQTRTGLDKNDILELLDLCLSNEFSFQNSYYTDKFQVHLWDLRFLVSLLKQ